MFDGQLVHIHCTCLCIPTDCMQCGSVRFSCSSYSTGNQINTCVRACVRACVRVCVCVRRPMRTCVRARMSFPV